jgi:hypothetical protein
MPGQIIPPCFQANRKILLFICIAGLLPILLFISSADATTVDGAAAGIATQLREKLGYQGEKVLIRSSNITEQESGFVLPFSAVMAQAMATALTANGATIIEYPPASGANYYEVVGTFNQIGRTISLNVGLRWVGPESSEHFLLHQQVPYRPEYAQWFTPNLTSAVTELVRKLVYNNMQSDYISLTVDIPQPAKRGEPTRRIGPRVQNLLTTAVRESKWGNIIVANSPSRLKCSYSLLNDEYLVLTARVFDQNNTEFTSAEVQLPLSAVAKELLEPVLVLTPSKKEDKTICTQFVSSSSYGIQPDSPISVQLLAELNEILTSMQINVMKCPNNKASQQIKVTMELKELAQKTAFTLYQGTIRFSLQDRSGKEIGSRQDSSKQMARDQIKAAEKIIPKIMSSQKENIASFILGQ